MKHTHFLKSSMAILVVLSLSISCKKESAPPAPTLTETGSPYTVEIILNHWSFSDSVFITTFTMPDGANSIGVNNKGVIQQISSYPITYAVGSYGSEYFIGKLWLNVYGNEAVLSFSNAANINPGTIVIEVTGTK